MKVVIVAEYYPRAADPTLGIWAHHQTRATRDAGADVRVIVLHRPVPPLATVRELRRGSVRGAVAATRAAAAQPSAVRLVGCLSNRTGDTLRHSSACMTSMSPPIHRIVAK